MPSRRHTLTSLLALALTGAARGEADPGTPITIVIAYPAGGPADLMARTLGDTLSRRAGLPVVVDSRPGGGGQIAATAVLAGPADGHTLLLGDMATLGTNPVLYRNFRYHPLTDFDAVAPLLRMPMVLFVPKASPFDTLAGLSAEAKTRPLNFASQGGGSTGHLLGEMLRAATGGQFNHVPYKGSAPAMTDLLAGHVDLLFDGLGPGLPHVRAGRLKALAVAGRQRLAQIPDVPTTAEEGLVDVALSIWFGMVVRMGTPAAIVRSLHADITEAMKQPDTVKRFQDLGFQPMEMDTDEFRRFIRSESDTWSAFIRRLGISID